MRDWRISIAVLSGRAEVSSWRELVPGAHLELSQGSRKVRT